MYNYVEASTSYFLYVINSSMSPSSREAIFMETNIHWVLSVRGI